tara:strand:- start:864 stop:1049 length:186 start_codon:yes stop_codon:yes gene_type:complete
MTFPQYAATQGVKSTDPLIDIIDCAVEHYEMTTPPCDPDYESLWFDEAHEYADKVSSKFAR